MSETIIWHVGPPKGDLHIPHLVYVEIGGDRQGLGLTEQAQEIGDAQEIGFFTFTPLCKMIRLFLY